MCVGFGDDQLERVIYSEDQIASPQVLSSRGVFSIACDLKLVTCNLWLVTCNLWLVTCDLRLVA